GGRRTARSNGLTPWGLCAPPVVAVATPHEDVAFLRDRKLQQGQRLPLPRPRPGNDLRTAPRVGLDLRTPGEVPLGTQRNHLTNAARPRGPRSLLGSEAPRIARRRFRVGGHRPVAERGGGQVVAAAGAPPLWAARPFGVVTPPRHGPAPACL